MSPKDEALLDAELVVRIEVATVTLPARAWSQLSPGDIITTDVRIGERVTLRSGGVAFASGELCEVDGRVAVRVTTLADDPQT